MPSSVTAGEAALFVLLVLIALVVIGALFARFLIRTRDAGAPTQIPRLRR